MRLQKLSRMLFLLECLLLAGCSGPQIKGPHISLCFVQEQRGGMECANKDGTQAFFPWSDLKEQFLAKHNGDVCAPRDDFLALVNWGKRK